jgi:uncharacterized membrane protein YsdA (DUF1294 family)
MRLRGNLKSWNDERGFAHSVQYQVHNRAPKMRQAETPASWPLPRLLAIPAFGLIWLTVASRWTVNPIVLAVYIGVSLLAFLAYAVDKSAAVNGHWRTSEKTLHLLSVVGGWPGALLAQQLLRHKCSKPSFVAVFWITVATNVAVFVLLHSGLLRNV